MGELGDQIDNMRVRVTVPSGAVSAELRGTAGLQLELAPGLYYRTDERELQAELSTAARLLFAARTRAYDDILRRADAYTVTAENASSPLDRQFFQRRDQVVAQGESGDGRVRVRAEGMRDWSVTIAAGTLRQLHEGEFAQRVEEAATALIRDQLEKVRQVRAEVYNADLRPHSEGWDW